MSKFNVGDGVEILNAKETINCKNGDIGYVIDGNSKYSVLVAFDSKLPQRIDGRNLRLIEPALTIAKVTEWLSENGYKFSIHNNEEPEFQWGEEVEVRDSCTDKWIKGTYLCKSPKDTSHIHMVMIDCSTNWQATGFKYCRKPKTKVTLDEIAEWKGVDKERIDIQ